MIWLTNLNAARCLGHLQAKNMSVEDVKDGRYIIIFYVQQLTFIQSVCIFGCVMQSTAESHSIALYRNHYIRQLTHSGV